MVAGPTHLVGQEAAGLWQCLTPASTWGQGHKLALEMSCVHIAQDKGCQYTTVVVPVRTANNHVIAKDFLEL